MVTECECSNDFNHFSFFRLKPCHTDRCVLTESVGCKCVKRLFSHLSHSAEVGLAAHS